MLPAILYTLTGTIALLLVPMRQVWSQQVLFPKMQQRQRRQQPMQQQQTSHDMMLLSEALTHGTPVTLANFSRIASPDIRQVIGEILAQLNATAGQVRQPLFTIKPNSYPVNSVQMTRVTRLRANPSTIPAFTATTRRPSLAVIRVRQNPTTISTDISRTTKSPSLTVTNTSRSNVEFNQLQPAELPHNQVRQRHSQEGKLRLVGGQTLFEGNVEINHMGSWGSICDDEWDLAEAQVVCRQMGFVLGAMRATTDSRYGKARRIIWMDSIFCTGFEEAIQDCPFAGWKKHDCNSNEAAGAICRTRKDDQNDTSNTIGNSITSQTPKTIIRTTTKSRRTSTHLPVHSSTQRPHRTSTTQVPRSVRRSSTERPNGIQTAKPTTQKPNFTLLKNVQLETLFGDIKVRLAGEQGQVEVRINDQWQVVCGDGWGLKEAQVVCKQLGMGFAENVMNLKLPEHEQFSLIISGIKCNGNESRISQCSMTDSSQFCPDSYENIAGVICAPDMPDLIPDAYALESSAFIEDRSILFLQCAMEENCLSRSAYELDKNDPSWIYETRRLLRFTASIHNIGKVDFRPFAPKHQWVWHSCHRHYHSMEVFAHFDLIDQAGNRVAEGHKASFCLEDNLCQEGSSSKYVCANYGDQGISVGCVDIYKYDLDCQWIDISDIDPGDYYLKITINPEYKVPEATFNNNAAMCRFIYTPIGGYVTNCTIVSP